MTVGEALNKAVQKSPSLNEHISDVRKIVDFRNILTDGYTNISDAVVWDILTTNLPRLV
ncbi:MAG: HepT-like ribonuclease domain-containing protein [Cyanobacteria bacterium P01_F01_bin.56]